MITDTSRHFPYEKSLFATNILISCSDEVTEYLVEYHNLLDYVTENYPDELRDKLGESEEES